MSAANPSTNSTKTLFNKDGIRVLANTLASPTDDEGGIVITLALNRHHEKNVINPNMISLLIEALDTIDTHPMLANTNNKALIITGLSMAEKNEVAAKFFCNGLDLEWMLRANNNDDSTGQPAKEKGNPTSRMIERFTSEVLARILTLPYRTVAAINGHCIGAGLFIALACDYRIMRTKKGYVQWPEARLGMRLTKGFAELGKAKITDHHVMREGVLTAKKYSPAEALASGIIDGEYPIEELYGHAFQLAREGLPESMKLEYFDPKSYTEIKQELYTDAYRALKFGKVDDLPHSRI